ncbi:MAG: HIRAN domain-containing protein, partial [Methanocorpusculum sp.]|nr:HIRAN domain-containing protein [Methanocorpusculum sp.]
TYHPWKKTDLRTGDARFIGMKNWNQDETLPPDDTDSLEKKLTRAQMGNVLRLIDETYIAGFSYVNLNSDEYQTRFFENKPLNLVLEPENQYDKKAVRIEDSEHVKLGYIPRAVNDIPYRLLYGGYHVYAYPVSIKTDAKDRYCICVVMDINTNVR